MDEGEGNIALPLRRDLEGIIASSGEETNKYAMSTQKSVVIHSVADIRKATVQCNPSVLHLGADALLLSFSPRCGARKGSDFACSTGWMAILGILVIGSSLSLSRLVYSVGLWDMALVGQETAMSVFATPVSTVSGGSGLCFSHSSFPLCIARPISLSVSRILLGPNRLPGSLTTIFLMRSTH